MHHPRSQRAFFDALGSKYVSGALINGEFTGQTKVQAELWLREWNASFGRRMAIFASVVALAAVLATLVAA